MSTRERSARTTGPAHIKVARPCERASLITLRASADRAGTAIRRARGDLRELEDSATPEERRPVPGTADAVADLEQLVSAVAVDRLSVNDLEVAGERAQQAV